MSPFFYLTLMLALSFQMQSQVSDEHKQNADESAKCGCNGTKPPSRINAENMYLDETFSELAEFIARLSMLDADDASPIHRLNKHIEDGNSVILKDDLIKALAHAESVIAEYTDQISDDQVDKISDMFNALIDVVAQDDLSVRSDVNRSYSAEAMKDRRDDGFPCDDVCDDDSALKIKKILCVLNKAIFCDVAVFRNGAIFCQRVEMKDGLDIRHRLRAHKAKIDKLDAKKAEIKKLEVNKLHAGKATFDNVSVCDVNVTCAINVPSAIVCDLEVTCTAVVDCDLMVGCNIYMNDSTDPLVGNIYKDNIPFLQNFGTDNTFVGDNAGNFIMTGIANAGFGNVTLFNNTTGTNNTAVGSQALFSNTTGTNNTATGTTVLLHNTTGIFNTASGQSAMLDNTTGSFNVATGAQALNLNTTGIDNTACGVFALQNNLTGDNNVAVGSSALQNNATVSGLTAVGSGALQNNTSGLFNAAFGFDAMQNNTSGGSNTACGYFASMMNTIGGGNTAIGVSALQENTEGMNNTAVGYNALMNNQDSQLVAVGSGALQSLVNGSGSQSVAVGFQALNLNVSGNSNTAVGWSALQSDVTTTLGNNTAVGWAGLQFNTLGTDNTALGNATLSANTSGIQNTAVGSIALENNDSGSDNVAVGYDALLNVLTGSNNIAIGSGAGQNVAGAESNDIYVGNAGVLGESAAIRIGIVGTQTTNFQAGIFGAGPIVGAAVLVDATTGQLGTVASSIRYKENVRDMKEESSAILGLRPVIFNYKADATHAEQFGLIAEEVYKIIPQLVVRNVDGLIETVKYHELAILLLNELIKINARLDIIEEQIMY